MPIQFHCNQCNQLLRVPEDYAGKTARCPNCAALMTVPAAEGATPPSNTTSPPPSPAPFSSAAASSSAATSANPFGSDLFPAGPVPAKPSGETPFASAGHFGGPPDSVNPYASPAGAGMLPMKFDGTDRPISPRPVAANTIFNYAWEVWKANLVLLVLVTLIVGAINYAISIPFSVVQAVLDQQGEAEAAVGVAIIGQILINVVQIWLGIGQAHINLKLARRQPASFGDLFGGMGLLLPVLGGSIIAFVGMALGLLLLIVPGILLALSMWPFYYLIVDRKTGVIESFQVAYRITAGNWATAFVLWLMSIGIMIAGCLALCVGLIFAAPLISMMFAVAYLMMSGQIELQPTEGGYPASYAQPPA